MIPFTSREYAILLAAMNSIILARPQTGEDRALIASLERARRLQLQREHINGAPRA